MFLNINNKSGFRNESVNSNVLSENLLKYAASFMSLYPALEHFLFINEPNPLRSLNGYMGT